MKRTCQGKLFLRTSHSNFTLHATGSSARTRRRRSADHLSCFAPTRQFLLHLNALSAAPTFFPPIKFKRRTGGEFVDGGIGCNNPTQTLLKEAKSYYRLKGYAATRPTCLVSIGTGQKDLIQLHKAASVFWLKDRTGLTIAPALAEIVTDYENTHDQVMQAFIEDNATDLYYRFDVPQGMQHIVLDEWDKADDIRTYTDKYMRWNQTEHELLECVRRLLTWSTQNSERQDMGQDKHRDPSQQRPLITQGSSKFNPTTVSGGVVFQGNYASF